MANQEHIEQLQRSIIGWNTWRKEHPEIIPDLNGADLSLANFNGADLSRADLTRANLSDADLIGADLNFANLDGANLSNVSLNNADLSRANLSTADLSRANLSNAHLFRANLFRANLFKATLFRTNLSGADLSNAHLSRAYLSGAYLNEANLSNANLFSAELNRADLNRANLSNADLNNVVLEWTVFADVDLRTVKGLETIVHKGPSTIGTDTLIRSRGDIPESFLRGAGLPDTFIEYIRSLVSRPIEYYTCFISYASRDEAFAKRLYTDLQAQNVRCWFAPEHMKTGDKIRDRIDESIRLYDKLLLVLSEHSVKSHWVEFEVESALDKERRKEVLVLFPVRLDRAVEDSTTSWARHLHRTRHITDFTHWKQHDDYQQALARLLHDLKAQPSSR